jgi:hypothetical protein
MYNKSLLIALVTLATAVKISGQIAGSEVDQNFGNTTIVYRDSAANDAQVLDQLYDQMGMSDVIRIVDAPKKSTKAVAPKQTAQHAATKPLLETPAFDPEPNTPSVTLVASLDGQQSLTNAPQARKDSQNWLKATRQEIAPVPPAAKVVPSVPKASQIKATGTKVASAKSVKKTGKLYKPSKQSKLGRWFKTHRVSLSSKSKYGCYRF